MIFAQFEIFKERRIGMKLKSFDEIVLYTAPWYIYTSHIVLKCRDTVSNAALIHESYYRNELRGSYTRLEF